MHLFMVREIRKLHRLMENSIYMRNFEIIGGSDSEKIDRVKKLLKEREAKLR